MRGPNGENLGRIRIRLKIDDGAGAVDSGENRDIADAMFVSGSMDFASQYRNT